MHLLRRGGQEGVGILVLHPGFQDAMSRSKSKEGKATSRPQRTTACASAESGRILDVYEQPMAGIGSLWKDEDLEKHT